MSSVQMRVNSRPPSNQLSTARTSRPLGGEWRLGSVAPVVAVAGRSSWDGVGLGGDGEVEQLGGELTEVLLLREPREAEPVHEVPAPGVPCPGPGPADRAALDRHRDST